MAKKSRRGGRSARRRTGQRRKQFHLVYEKKWKVWRVKGYSTNARDKRDAMRLAITLAKDTEPSSLVIHKKNGVIQSERTYPRSSDPFLPKG